MPGQNRPQYGCRPVSYTHLDVYKRQVFENTPNYELPSTGGIGTFWYTIGGVLLMMAAALMLYRNKSYIK